MSDEPNEPGRDRKALFMGGVCVGFSLGAFVMMLIALAMGCGCGG